MSVFYLAGGIRKCYIHDMPKKRIDILDVTIRDGSYLIDFKYTPRQVEDLVELLDDAGVKYIEACHGLGLGSEKIGPKGAASDIEYAQAAHRGRKRAHVGAIGHWRYTKLAEIDSVAEYIDFFRIICGAHEVENAKMFVRHCKEIGLESFVQMSRTPSVSPKVAADAARRLSDWGADIVYLVDTTGCLISGEVKQYVKKAKRRARSKIGFHAHNMLQHALSNTVEAIDAGADVVDASLMGVGRDNGNASLEALVMVLKKLEIECGISFEKLMLPYEYARKIFNEAKRPGWYATYLASFRRDIYPLSLIDILAVECKKTPFEVINTFIAMQDVIEVTLDDLRRLTEKLGGDPDMIFKKYNIRALS